jgi:hypothetical protein
MTDQPLTLVEPISKVRPASESRFGLTPLQQFSRAGLDLKIGDFRQMCHELHGRQPTGSDMDEHEIADLLYVWMTDTLGAPPDNQP